MPKMMSINCRVMFGQNIVMQKKPINCAISVKADGSDSIQDIKIKIAVSVHPHNIYTCIHVLYQSNAGTFAQLPHIKSSTCPSAWNCTLRPAWISKSWQSFHWYVESFCNLKE